MTDREPPDNATIVATATAAGQAGVGIVRLSGPSAAAIGRRLFAGHRPLEHGRMRFGSITDGEGGTLDRGYGVLFSAPRSYTGEDVIEFHCHGSPANLERVVAAARRAGARAARPGEFSLRAYLNGRIDLAQAEAVMALVAAPGPEAAGAAMRVLSGGLGRRIEPLRCGTLELLAGIETRLEFPDEAPGAPDDEARAAVRLGHDALGLARDIEAGLALGAGLTVVIAGPANAGKSTLFNRLLGRPRALVADRPGTTRDYLSEEMTIGGRRIVLVDTAGMGPSCDPLDGEGMRLALEQAAGAGIVVHLHSLADGLGEADRETIECWRRNGGRVIIAGNKSDLAPAVETPAGVFRLSLRSGDGVPELEGEIACQVAAAVGKADCGERALAGSRRQVEELECAAGAFRRAGRLLAERAGDELAAEELHAARRALDRMEGRQSYPGMLDSIFGRFCLGK